MTTQSGHQFLGINSCSHRRDFNRTHDAAHPTLPYNALPDGEHKSKVKLVIQLACSPLVVGSLFTCISLTGVSGLLKGNDTLLEAKTPWLLQLNPLNVGYIKMLPDKEANKYVSLFFL